VTPPARTTGKTLRQWQMTKMSALPDSHSGTGLQRVIFRNRRAKQQAHPSRNMPISGRGYNPTCACRGTFRAGRRRKGCPGMPGTRITWTAWLIGLRPISTISLSNSRRVTCRSISRYCRWWKVPINLSRILPAGHPESGNLFPEPADYTG